MVLLTRALRPLASIDMTKLLSLVTLIYFITGTSAIPVHDQCTYLLANLEWSRVIDLCVQGGGIDCPGWYLSLDLKHSSLI